MKPYLERTRLHIGLMMAATTVLTGCNLEGQSVEGGISGTGFIIGPLELDSSARSLTSEPDSVTIRGRTFDTSSATFTVPSDLQKLAEGMLLRVDGDWDSASNGDATAIIYDDTLRGPLDASNIDDRGVGTLTVSGQKVEVTSDTVLTGITSTHLQDLSSGSVRVSGWSTGGANDSEAIRASWIYYSGEDDAFSNAEIEGIVSSYDSDTPSFSIGGLNVTFNQGAVDDGLTLEDGIRVEVTGTINAGTLEASKIEGDDATRLFRGDDDDDSEIEGPIASVSETSTKSSGSMTLNGLTVIWSRTGVFDDDLTHEQLRIGLPVEVEGTWRNGELVAEEIELGDGLAEISGQISAKSDEERTLTIGGVKVTVPNFARLVDDEADDDTATLAFGNLAVNDYVEVEGIFKENGDDTPTIEALVIERDDDDDTEIELRAPVAGTSGTQAAGQITLAGITVSVNADTAFEDTRFSDITAGDILEVTYSGSGDDKVASEVDQDD